MKITTNYSYRKTVNNLDYYAVWAQAAWLKYPIMRLSDTFTLTTNGMFDSSYTESANIKQTFYCSSCYTETLKNRSIFRSTPVNDNIKFKYSNFVPYIQFSSYVAGCKNCSDGGIPNDSHYSVYIKYGIIVNGAANIQAGYAYKTIGIGESSVNIDTNGAFSFSAPITLDFTPYIARAVTVKR